MNEIFSDIKKILLNTKDNAIVPHAVQKELISKINSLPKWDNIVTIKQLAPMVLDFLLYQNLPVVVEYYLDIFIRIIEDKHGVTFDDLKMKKDGDYTELCEEGAEFLWKYILSQSRKDGYGRLEFPYLDMLMEKMPCAFNTSSLDSTKGRTPPALMILNFLSETSLSDRIRRLIDITSEYARVHGKGLYFHHVVATNLLLHDDLYRHTLRKAQSKNMLYNIDNHNRTVFGYLLWFSRDGDVEIIDRRINILLNEFNYQFIDEDIEIITEGDIAPELKGKLSKIALLEL